ncbi:LapD/MoxY N-terminal periplasmic domain-containing protein [Aeromonas cavernicola]|uniref:LapD/MoxY periplasmic domain-containing protein n=1 Tax=Aeromonas cavernicola TaxID=1006623 RepID=A0A2H9U1B1_9GAMM|nr:LapD/MoxY N-terminal periplasmic domain-containing protein [Aeromonas cavernicola]PJG57811.1 hypothetical protein CUC53_15905 [Aeromonas cavernicola]
MSFAKRLNIMIFFLFLTGSIALVSLEVNTLRRSILDQMQANLETSTTALGLVLQGTLLNGDKVLSETIINAMFDGGFVNSATLIDPDGKVLFERKFSSSQQNIPSWFTELIDMPAVAHEQEMTDGWNILGTIHLSGHTGYAYQYLWQALRTEVSLLFLGLLVSMISIQIFCYWLLSPLRKIPVDLNNDHVIRGEISITEPDMLEAKAIVIAIKKLINFNVDNLKRQKLNIFSLIRDYPQAAIDIDSNHNVGVTDKYTSFKNKEVIYTVSNHVNDDLINIKLTNHTDVKTKDSYKGIKISMDLIDVPESDWGYVLSTLNKFKEHIIDFRYATTNERMQLRLAELKNEGFNVAFHNFIVTEDSMSLLQYKPLFISTSVHFAPILWSMITHYYRTHGVTMLCESTSPSVSVNMLCEWGFEGTLEGERDE